MRILAIVFVLLVAVIGAIENFGTGNPSSALSVTPGVIKADVSRDKNGMAEVMVRNGLAHEIGNFNLICTTVDKRDQAHVALWKILGTVKANDHEFFTFPMESGWDHAWCDSKDEKAYLDGIASR